MGQLRKKIIQQTRIWLDPDPAPIPDLDYDFMFPITCYDAVHRTMEDTSTTLTDEIDAIYAQIRDKQNLISGGVAGRLLTFTGVDGHVGETEILKSISDDPSVRSNAKVPSEKAVGDKLDLKANFSDFNSHNTDEERHITAEERITWDSKASYEQLEEHILDEDVHTTAEEKEAWNAKADGTTVDEHIQNKNNPHSVTAHQIGAYSRSEIDDMFDAVRNSFFIYKNIKYDERTDTAEFVDYDEDEWNPNYVLAYSDELPEVTDQSLIYFAVKPATDYATNESNECLIYMKKPNAPWSEVGVQEMEPGYMVIRYPDTTMCVWVQGRFLTIFTGSSSEGGEDSFMMWRPVINEDGVLGWTRSYETAPPDLVCIKGPAGYTPQKGIDYFDGASGIGVPGGGIAKDVLIKITDNDYDTGWMSFGELLGDYFDDGEIHGITIDWDNIQNQPAIYNSTGDSTTGLMTQKAITDQFESVQHDIEDLQNVIGGSGGVGGLTEELHNHLHDYNNPHHVSPADIGAASLDQFNLHSTNQNNPHSVTAFQVGLGNVDNTRDIDKPISAATQIALNTLLEKINEVAASIGDGNLICNVIWDDSDCTLTFVFRNGDELSVTIPIVEIFNSIYFDDSDSSLVIVLPDGSEHRIHITDLITIYHGFDGNNILVEVEGDTIKASIKPDSITGALIAPSIELRGSPTTYTQSNNDKSKKIATTEYVKNIVIDNVTSIDTDRPLSANMGLWLNQHKTSEEDVRRIIEDMPGLNVIDSLDSTDRASALSANMGHELSITKAPWIHTSETGSTYGQATSTVFGHARASSDTPRMDGVADTGTDNGFYSRGDHRHPTDTSRAPIDSPAFTGTPTTPTPDNDDNSTNIANTEWVLANAKNGFHYLTAEEIHAMVEEAYEDVIGA